MKDTKFTELLNLYLDHQITPEDSALLEAEIQRDTKRMQLYRQYCRMHKACSQLADSYRENAPTRRPLVLQRQRRDVGLYATGLIAAAACIALAIIIMPADYNGSPGLTVQPESPAPALASSEIPMTPVPVLPALTPRNQELQTVFSTRALAQLGENSTRETILTVGQQGRLDWLTDVQPSPLQFDFGVFEPINTDSQETRTFRSQRPFHGNVELTAFQFQR